MARFLIDGYTHEVDMNGNFSFGESEMLSQQDTDPTYGQDWYDMGFKVADLLDKEEFAALQEGISNCICKIAGWPKLIRKSFTLEQYHLHIPDDEAHFYTVGQTRDLFPEDFSFDVAAVVRKLEGLLGFELTDIDPDTGKRLHIIVRINRPNSLDYNPPHKDIYQQFDETGVIPKCVNFWLPICGVNAYSMLPIAPYSHRVPENKILRTFDGGEIGSNKYRVRGVLTWDGDNAMFRPTIRNGQVLIFSSHLIHGCAINEQTDTTRIALEFRLFPSVPILRRKAPLAKGVD